jgi:hypothetical protein
VTCDSPFQSRGRVEATDRAHELYLDDAGSFQKNVETSISTALWTQVLRLKDA